jgi:hypothetical protein
MDNLKPSMNVPNLSTARNRLLSKLDRGFLSSIVDNRTCIYESYTINIVKATVLT